MGEGTGYDSECVRGSDGGGRFLKTSGISPLEEMEKKMIRETLMYYRGAVKVGTDDCVRKRAEWFIQRFQYADPERIKNDLSLLAGAVKAATDEGLEREMDNLVDLIYRSLKSRNLIL